jgi:hypothetical protein
MAVVTREKIEEVAEKLWAEVYEHAFRGKRRGRFALTREQLRDALDVHKLHATTIEKLQEISLDKGLVVIDLDDLFPCVEIEVVRKYRRPPKSVFQDIFGISGDDEVEDEVVDLEADQIDDED